MPTQEPEHEFSFKDLFVPFTTLKAIHWIIFIGLVVYFNSLFNGFVWDDFGQIVNNLSIHSIKNIGLFFLNSTGFSGLTGMYYKPLLFFVFSLLYAIFANWAPGYHIFQLILHILDTILLFFLLKKFLKKEISFLIVLLFLIHPINNESVVWIAALQEPLFVFFGLVALLLVMKDHIGKIGNITIFFLLLLSLLSKETGFLFLLVIPLFDLLFHRGWKLSLVRSSIVCLAYLVLRLFIARVPIGNAYQSAIPIDKFSFISKLINFPAIIFYYLKTFIYPQILIADQRWAIKSVNFYNFFTPLIFIGLFVGASFIFSIFLYKNEKKLFKVFVFFSLWLLLGLVFHIHILPLDFTVSDRWFYFPIIGLLTMVGVVLTVVYDKFKEYSLYLTILIIVVMISFCVRDFIRNQNWKDTITLYKSDLQVDPNNYKTQSGLAEELYNIGKYNEAMYHAMYSIRLNPSNENWTIFGLINNKTGHIKEAEIALNTALSFNDSYATYLTLSRIMLVNDSTSKTIPFLKKFIKKYPNDPYPWLYLAIELYKGGNKEEAISAVNKSYSISPSKESIYVYNSIVNGRSINFIE